MASVKVIDPVSALPARRSGAAVLRRDGRAALPRLAVDADVGDVRQPPGGHLVEVGQRVEGPAESGSITAAYRAFRAPAADPGQDLGEQWAEGPVRFLMTPQERAGFQRLSDPVTRSEFVIAFWKARDPQPETPENPMEKWWYSLTS